MAALNPELDHHVRYGARPEPQLTRAQSSDWRGVHLWPRPPKRAPWSLRVPAREVPKLLLGLVPADMDDKWFVYADGPALGTGAVVLHMVRSWTGDHILDVLMSARVDAQGELVEGADARITGIAWVDDRKAYNGDMTEDEAKETALEVCRWCLDADIPDPE